MDNLSRFYIDLATDAAKAQAFINANAVEKQQMLETAGIDGSSELVTADQNSIKQMMMTSLSKTTGSWQGLDNNADNDDNKNNIGRLGLRNRTQIH